MSRRRYWPIILVGVVLMLAHVCALPAEAVTPVNHAEADEHSGHDDSVHAGSCEAVPTSDAMAPVPIAAADRLLSAPPGSWAPVSRDMASTAVPPSAPLFLLHAALLI
jgi:hypothetical protein